MSTGFYCTPATSCPFSMAPLSLSEFMGTVHIHNTEQLLLAIDCSILHGLSHVCHQHLLGQHLFVPPYWHLFHKLLPRHLHFPHLSRIAGAFPHPHHVCDHLHAHVHYDKLLLNSHNVFSLTRLLLTDSPPPLTPPPNYSEQLLLGKDCDILNSIKRSDKFSKNLIIRDFLGLRNWAQSASGSHRRQKLIPM